MVPVPAGQCVLNGPLADALGVGAGQTVLLSLPRISDMPGQALLAKRSRTESLTILRLTVSRVERGDGFAGAFRLDASQRVGHSAWVNLDDLQRAVGQPGRANLLLVAGGEAAPSAETLAQALGQAVRLEDYGLHVEPESLAASRPTSNQASTSTPATAPAAPPGGFAMLGSDETYLPPPVEPAADACAGRIGIPRQQGAGLPRQHGAGLAAGIASRRRARFAAGSGKVIRYAVAAGLSELDGQPLANDQIALNQWAADQLSATPGDGVELAYYVREPTGELREVRRAGPADSGNQTFHVERIVPMSGLGADAALTPKFPGLTDAASIRDWKPPQGLAINLNLVTPADDDYWARYHAAPKLFVSLTAAQRMWAGPFGQLTGIRLPADRTDAFAEALRRRLSPASMGLAFRPVRAEQLSAAAGSTDFGQLFLGLSLFLIASAGVLVALLFGLNVERRSRQLGLMMAIGFTAKSLRRLVLAEGALVAAAGAVVGLAGAVGYTWLMMAGLRTFWRPAVGNMALGLHVTGESLAIGWAASFVVAMVAVLFGLRRLSKVPAAGLLAGAWGAGSTVRRRRSRRGLAGALGLTVLAAAVLASGPARLMEIQWAFLAGGGLLLAASLAWLGWLIRPARGGSSSMTGAWPLLRLGIRNAGRNATRSLLTAGLLALATFSVATVAAFRQGPPTDTADPRSGAGGYSMILQTDIPLPADPGNLAGRRLMGVLGPDDPRWAQARFVCLPRRLGQDISCLNLAAPVSPTVLGVLADPWHGRFTFARSQPGAPGQNPWSLLDGQPGGAIPFVADDETARYILHLDLGQSMGLTDSQGRLRRFVLVGTLEQSIFQGELLISRENFSQLFPDQAGFGTVLIIATPAQQDWLRRQLASQLGDYGADIEPTAELLGQYRAVANTYLSTFQVLGRLGLLMGAAGLAVVLLRSLIERRGELALLEALGFARGGRMRIVLAENGFLLLLGLAAGLACALVGAAPTLVGSARSLNLGWLGLALGLVAAAGLGCLLAAMWFGARRLGPADLRRE